MRASPAPPCLAPELPPAAPPNHPLRQAYVRLRSHYGHQHWWPGDTPFEVCVGAILTQNTNWTNVERAIANLKRAGVLEAHALYALPEADLAELIRPSGYYRVKARRLRAFLRVLMQTCDGRLDRLFDGPLPVARERLLAISGIGPETADSLLLYAGGRASFVVDAYTKRVFQRHGWISPAAGYAELQARCVAELDAPAGAERLDYWQDYHAQIVMVGKEFCRARESRCDRCPLRPLLDERACRWQSRGSPIQLAEQEQDRGAQGKSVPTEPDKGMRLHEAQQPLDDAKGRDGGDHGAQAQRGPVRGFRGRVMEGADDLQRSRG
jgi:endonuclease III related protein